MSLFRTEVPAAGDPLIIPQKAYRNAGGEVLVLDAGEAPPAGFVEFTPAPGGISSMQDYDTALMGLYDSTAQAMGYLNWQTCALRAHRPGPFEAEGTAFYDWMEACNVQGYAILAGVTGGQREQPTIEQFLSEMPAFVRPQ